MRSIDSEVGHRGQRKTDSRKARALAYVETVAAEMHRKRDKIREMTQNCWL